MIGRRKTMFGPGGETLEASALAFVPPKTGKFASDCIITGFWETREVKAYTLPALELKKEYSASFPCFPNSVVLHDFGDDVARPLMHLLVGLADGSLHSFSVTEEGLGERKVVSLGDLPISLVRCKVDGLSTVLATGTRASLFFWKKDTLHHSPVLVKVSADVATPRSLLTLPIRMSQHLLLYITELSGNPWLWHLRIDLS